MFILQLDFYGSRKIRPSRRFGCAERGNLNAPRVGRQPLELSDRPDGRCRDEDFSPPTGSPEAVARPRLPQNVACGFPAPRSSAVGSQLSLLSVQVSFPWSSEYDQSVWLPPGHQTLLTSSAWQVLQACA